MPAGGFEFVIMLAITWLCIKFPNYRAYTNILAMTIALIGTSLVFGLPFNNKAGLLGGYYLVRSP